MGNSLIGYNKNKLSSFSIPFLGLRRELDEVYTKIDEDEEEQLRVLILYFEDEYVLLNTERENINKKIREYRKNYGYIVVDKDIIKESIENSMKIIINRQRKDLYIKYLNPPLYVKSISIYI